MSEGATSSYKVYVHGRRNDESSVRVYTVNQESRHVVVESVAAIGLEQELLKMVALYGVIEHYNHIDDHNHDGHQVEEFTDAFLFRFQSIQAARVAKRKLNGKSFFGRLLKVRYGPEYESPEDVAAKLWDRRRSVAHLINKHSAAAQPVRSLPLPAPAPAAQPPQPSEPRRPQPSGPYPSLTPSLNASVRAIRKTLQNLDREPPSHAPSPPPANDPPPELPTPARTPINPLHPKAGPVEPAKKRRRI